MGNSLKNITVILGLVTIAFGGYYLFTQYSSSQSEFDFNEQTMQNMLNNTSVFIDHRTTLDSIKLDLGLFEDQRFISLRDFSTPIEESPVGRPNPFSEVDKN